MSYFTGTQLRSIEDMVGKTIESVRQRKDDEIFLKFTDGSFIYGQYQWEALQVFETIDLSDAIVFGVASEKGKVEHHQRQEAYENQIKENERQSYERLKAKFEGDHSS